MSIVQPPVPDRRPSPSGELATNNPFRARLSGVPLSPGTNTERFSFVSTNSRERPKSRNPFLDVFDDDDNLFDPSNEQRRPHKSNSFDASSAKRPELKGAAAELFENLTLNDNSGRKMSQDIKPTPRMRPPPPPPGGHERRASEEPTPLISVSTWGGPQDKGRPGQSSRRAPPPPGFRPNGDRSGDRPREPRRRPRRNSDSSVIDAHEAEHRDRSMRSNGRHGASKSRSKRDVSSDKRKKNSALDVIDKLDVTGVYGSGLFHHDGPFDACNPHRNKSSRRLAPVQAFPADSANNSMVGLGPTGEKVDHSHVFGNRDPEAFNDYTTASRPSVKKGIAFDPKAAIDLQHGDESLGLGTSTFLDGAPVSRVAKQKNLEEQIAEGRPRSTSDAGNDFGGGGLTRKKSLAQKIRAIGEPGTGRRRAPPPPGRKVSADSRPSPVSPSEGKNGHNPFFNDSYDAAYDRKGETITVTERSDRGPGSPRKNHPALQRAGTDDGAGNGLLQRVRSLSKPKRRND